MELVAPARNALDCAFAAVTPLSIEAAIFVSHIFGVGIALYTGNLRRFQKRPSRKKFVYCERFTIVNMKMSMTIKKMIDRAVMERIPLYPTNTKRLTVQRMINS
jgi:hypothetical protein